MVAVVVALAVGCRAMACTMKGLLARQWWQCGVRALRALDAAHSSKAHLAS
jgi:hypothetical protein